MNDEMLNTLEELSKKETTDLALTVMELTADNMIKDKEIQRLNNIINELEKFLNKYMGNNVYEDETTTCFNDKGTAYFNCLCKLKELKEGK